MKEIDRIPDELEPRKPTASFSLLPRNQCKGTVVNQACKSLISHLCTYSGKPKTLEKEAGAQLGGGGEPSFPPPPPQHISLIGGPL